MTIKELKQDNEENPHKIRFDSAFEINGASDLKKSVDKNFHFFILEECPFRAEHLNSKSKVQSVMKPV